ncbi:MAG: fused MFS/spermidine synthase [Planctomycetes bacterium]|nr:fused MFS/spermidine synthase [Planctomycetota bacterium]
MRAHSVLVQTIALVAGACTMTIELAAVRVLSPWFGASTAVWTNVIGVVLLALSLGYLIGARASRAVEPARILGWILCCAAVFGALIPLASGTVARLFLPAELTLAEAGTLVPWGSLAASLCLFLPPATALGCIAPLCTEVLARRAQRSAGSAGGLILCASTLGSLAGTFATTFVLVPKVGTTHTFLIASAALAALGVTALLGLARSRAGLVASVAWIAPIGLWSVPAALPALSPERTLLATTESTYQSVRVVEDGGTEPRLRYLQVNESFDSFQSVWSPQPGFLPTGYYYNHFVFPLWWSRDRTDWHIGVVGLGAGTAWRVIDGARPAHTAVRCTGAEIDPEVVRLAREWMDMPRDDARCRVLSGYDGRALVGAGQNSFDLLILDAYANQTEIPAHLSSVEFFRECRSALRESGWLAINVGGFGFDDPVVTAVASTLARAFEERVLGLRVPFSRNFVLFARRAARPVAPPDAAWKTGDPDIDARLSAVALEGNWRWFEAREGEVLTDDRNPIEALQRLSILRATQRGLE